MVSLANSTSIPHTLEICLYRSNGNSGQEVLLRVGMGRHYLYLPTNDKDPVEPPWQGYYSQPAGRTRVGAGAAWVSICCDSAVTEGTVRFAAFKERCLRNR